MNDIENFRPVLLLPESQEAFGRWLCLQFYCNQSELLATMPELGPIFERAVKMHSGWTELLSGAYRSGGKHLLKQKRVRSPKWARLGEVVRPGLPSIDGIGDVREKELVLYRLIAWEVAQLWRASFHATPQDR
jgi:hypothetical protein